MLTEINAGILGELRNPQFAGQRPLGCLVGGGGGGIEQRALLQKKMKLSGGEWQPIYFVRAKRLHALPARRPSR